MNTIDVFWRTNFKGLPLGGNEGVPTALKDALPAALPKRGRSRSV